MHGITTEHAFEHGRPLREALIEFMYAAKSVYEQGGCVVSHHLEFDAGIIYAELKRSGLEEWTSLWSTIAGRGICTMDRDIQNWMRCCFGRVLAPGEKTLVLSLGDSLRAVHRDTKTVQEILMKQHSAGADSQMHRLLFISLLSLAREARDN